jgi:hypothetical protein
MPDVLTAAIIHRSKDLAFGSAERWAGMEGDGLRDEGATERGPKRRLPYRNGRSKAGQGLKSSVDVSKGKFRHSPRIG